MALDSFIKQVAESITIAADFEDNALSGETAVLLGSSVIAVDSAGVDVTSTVIYSGSEAVSGTQLSCRVQAGTEAGSPYKITFKIATSAGNLWEVDVTMRVKET